MKTRTAVSAQMFPAEALRAHFPALQRAGSFVFFDNAAGAQVPQSVLDAVNRHLLDHNVQRGGRYPQSIAVDATIARARASVAAFVNARRPEEIAFGMNATSFIRTIS
ncbi:MAG TPA: aminotransferase class V-fold PLP-dependent enzyme, partial [Steroidobacteraceae bacterium]